MRTTTISTAGLQFSAALQLERVWAFVACKKKSVTPEIAAFPRWRHLAVVASTRTASSSRRGTRDSAISGCAGAPRATLLTGSAIAMQLTSDGFRAYLEAVEARRPWTWTYAMLQKIYGAESEAREAVTPAKILGGPTEVMGSPGPKHISTSFVERQNWTMRTRMRRYTRLSNGFSRKMRNHAAAVALNYFAYNFVSIHRTLT